MPLERYTFELSGWKGLNTLPNVTDKDPRYVEDCMNVDFDEFGVIQKRKGWKGLTQLAGRIAHVGDFQKITGFSGGADDVVRGIFVAGTNLVVMKMDGYQAEATFTTVNTPHYQCSTNNGVCYIANETNDYPKMLFYLNSSWSYQSASFEAPASAPSISATGSGSFTGSVQAIYTYVDAFGNETNPSPESSVVTAANDYINVGVTASSDAAVSYISIYLMPASLTTFRLAQTVSNTTGTFSLTMTEDVVSGGDEAVYTSYGCPKGKYVAIYNDMLIVAGREDAPDQVDCSDWIFHRQFNTEENFDRVTSNDGQPIVGLGQLFGELVVGKADSMHIASGADQYDFHTRPYNQDYGAVGGRSLASIQKKLIYESDDGIYIDSGGIPLEISRLIRPTIRSVRASVKFGRPTKHMIGHDRYYKKLYFAVRRAASDGECDTLLVYNYETDAWTMYSSATDDITAMGNLQDALDLEYLYGGNSDGTIFLFDTPNGGINYDYL